MGDENSQVAVPVREQDSLRSWWKSPGNLVAVAAFVLSVLTAILSGVSAYFKDIHDRQAELSAVVEKLVVLPLQSRDAIDKYKSDTGFNVGGVLTSVNSMLVHRAYELARTLGRRAPSSELFVIGETLVLVENYEAAKEIDELALRTADNFFDEVAALRALGTVKIGAANDAAERAEGDALFEQANKIGQKYPRVGNNLPELSYTVALNEMNWATAWSVVDCAQAKAHLETAQARVLQAGDLPAASDLVWRLKGLAASLSGCGAGQRVMKFLPPPPQENH